VVQFKIFEQTKHEVADARLYPLLQEIHVEAPAQLAHYADIAEQAVQVVDEAK
jgi:hypothetical protein